MFGVSKDFGAFAFDSPGGDNAMRGGLLSSSYSRFTTNRFTPLVRLRHSCIWYDPSMV
jgi:hypothetical protein